MRTAFTLLAVAVLCHLSSAQVCGLLDTGGSWGTGSSGVDGDLLLDGSPAGPGITLSAATYTIDLSDDEFADNYCPERWAMVFQYTTIDVQAGYTVTFANHPSRAPVYWLATGDVNIAGTVNLDGERGSNWDEPNVLAEPGPGGFRGGPGYRPIAKRALSGLGPGGGYPHGLGLVSLWPTFSGSNGSYLTVGAPYREDGTWTFVHSPGESYGDPVLKELMGGSAGAGGGWPGGALQNSGGGGGGGGAIAICSESSLTVSGAIVARGGAGGIGQHLGFAPRGGNGAGGAIRLVAPEVLLTGGTVLVSGGFGDWWTYGGGGILRVESLTMPSGWAQLGPENPATFSNQLAPVFQEAVPRVAVESWQDPATLLWYPAPQDPRAAFAPFEDVDIPGDVGVELAPGTIRLRILTENVAPGSTGTLRAAQSDSGIQSIPFTVDPNGAFPMTLTEVEITFEERLLVSLQVTIDT